MLSLHRRNSLRRTLYHLHNRETFPYSSKDNFDHYLVIHSWITFVPSCQTCGKAHIRCGTHHGIPYRAYGKSIGDDLRPSSSFCRGQVLSLTQLHTLQIRQELLLRLIYFELLQNHAKVCVLLKVSSGVLIYLYRSWCPICKQLYPGLPLKNTLQTTVYAFQKFYIISNQQYVIHIYLSEML